MSSATQRSPRRRRRRIALTVLVAVAATAAAAGLVVGGSSGTSHADPRRIDSIFQDDRYLLYSPAPTVANTLAALRSLGVDRVRLTILWRAIAPDPGARTPPRGFDGADPAAYPASAWAPYDRVVELARARGIAVDFNVTAPGPRWAMAAGAPNAKAADHYRPSVTAFAQFVAALGRRYSGSYPAPASAGVRGAPAGRLPRVSYWSIWNEPNQPGWLWPQWRTVAGHRAMDAPRLYRLYVDAGFAALRRTGHTVSSDTILIGELAPEGSSRQTEASPIPPLPFLRALYCVDGADRPLRGSAATLLHCPTGGSTRTFAGEHRALFEASGIAHHPYSFFLAPTLPMSDPDFVPLSELGRLERELDRIFAVYGVARTLPIYITEYGYETNPPNPFRGVSPQRQAQYLDQAQYMAWSDSRVRSFAQFLLVDSAPDTRYPRGSLSYWSTFQTGLLYLGGRQKPALDAYRLPLVVPSPAFSRGASVRVWGLVRPAAATGRRDAVIQWSRTGGAYRTLTHVTAAAHGGVFSASVAPPGSGTLRILWTGPGGIAFHSRPVAVQQR